MYKVILLTCFTMITSKCFCQADSLKKIISTALEDSFSVSSNVEQVDKSFIKYLKKKNGFDLTLASPTDSFNTTDYLVANFPNKRLIALFKGKKVNVVEYERGGNAMLIMCIIYFRKKEKYISKNLQLLEKAESVSDFKNLLRTAKYRSLN